MPRKPLVITGNLWKITFLFRSPSISQTGFGAPQGDQPPLSLGGIYCFHIEMLLPWNDQFHSCVVRWVDCDDTKKNYSYRLKAFGGVTPRSSGGCTDLNQDTRHNQGHSLRSPRGTVETTLSLTPKVAMVPKQCQHMPVKQTTHLYSH